MSAEEVLALVMVVRAAYPSLWGAVNLLGRPAVEVLRRGLEVCEGRIDGIWTDNAGGAVDGGSPAAEAFFDARTERGWQGLYFGGVAFKYQAPVAPERLGDVARTAVEYMDVVCTSGPGTALLQPRLSTAAIVSTSAPPRCTRWPGRRETCCAPLPPACSTGPKRPGSADWRSMVRPSSGC